MFATYCGRYNVFDPSVFQSCFFCQHNYSETEKDRLMRGICQDVIFHYDFISISRLLVALSVLWTSQTKYPFFLYNSQNADGDENCLRRPYYSTLYDLIQGSTWIQIQSDSRILFVYFIKYILSIWLKSVGGQDYNNIPYSTKNLHLTILGLPNHHSNFLHRIVESFPVIPVDAIRIICISILSI